MAGLCRAYGFSMDEVRRLQLWEIDVLVSELQHDAMIASLPHG